MMYNQPLLTCRLPSQMVLINGDRDLPAPPTWGSGGFTVGETAFSSRPCTRCGPPSLAMRAPWNVSWAQEISAIGIHNSQYFLGPMNSFWASQSQGGVPTPVQHAHAVRVRGAEQASLLRRLEASVRHLAMGGAVIWKPLIIFH